MISSSQKYEYILARHLSKYADIKILSKACKKENSVTINNIELIGVKDGHKKSFLADFDIIKILKHQQESIAVVFWGYDLITVLCMLFVNIYKNITCFPFVFDSHRPAIRNFKFFKKLMAELYFSLGKFFVRFFNGYILFQENAVNKLGLRKKPYLVIKPGIPKYQREFNNNYSDVYNITFCGTLSKLNGTDILLKSLEYLKDLPVAIHLCGSGELVEDVIKATDKYPFLKYYGVLTSEELLEIYDKSNLLLNLRCLDDEAMDYAFPSKTFEYIAVGKPLLTTKVLDDDIFIENVFLLEEFSAEDLANQIRFAFLNREEAIYKTTKLKEFVENQYSFDSSAKKIIDFISMVLKE